LCPVNSRVVDNPEVGRNDSPAKWSRKALVLAQMQVAPRVADNEKQAGKNQRDCEATIRSRFAWIDWATVLP
jgi:hypothetical protein